MELTRINQAIAQSILGFLMLTIVDKELTCWELNGVTIKELEGSDAV